MMFDPTSLGESLKPGDKMTLAFHKGQPKSSAPSFMGNVQASQGAPGAASASGPPPAGPTMMGASAAPPQAGAGLSAMMPQTGDVPAGGIGPDPHAMMAAALQRRMMGQ